MNYEMLLQMNSKKGFIAALDQSGGSSPKALKNYGVLENEYSNEEEMFDLIHQMRTRVITSEEFSSKKIIGAILFDKTMKSKINGKYSADFLWSEKHIVPFLKIDKGLLEKSNGVKLMKKIPNIDAVLDEAAKFNIFGTKERSVIFEDNEKGIHDIVVQQFELAKKVIEHGLVPIIEPEVDINCPNKVHAEELLKQEILVALQKLPIEDLVMLKLTIPSIPNFYEDIIHSKHVLRMVALSGGYSQTEACEKLSQNDHIIASFSRALLQDLNVNQSKEEFDTALRNAVDKIYKASI